MEELKTTIYELMELDAETIAAIKRDADLYSAWRNLANIFLSLARRGNQTDIIELYQPLANL